MTNGTGAFSAGSVTVCKKIRSDVEAQSMTTIEMDIYDQLAHHLDQLPAGYPATESGVERRILRRLFTPEKQKFRIIDQAQGRIFCNG